MHSQSSGLKWQQGWSYHSQVVEKGWAWEPFDAKQRELECVCVSLPEEPVFFLTDAGWRLYLSSISLVIFHYHDNQIAMMPRQFTQQHMTFITSFFFLPVVNKEQFCAQEAAALCWIWFTKFKCSLSMYVLFLCKNIYTGKIKMRWNVRNDKKKKNMANG